MASIADFRYSVGVALAKGAPARQNGTMAGEMTVNHQSHVV